MEVTGCESVTAVKIFIVQAPGIFVLKPTYL